MRIRHTMIRVSELERSLKFYTEVLGMHVLRRKDYPDGRFTLAFVGYAPESEEAVLELTHNWDTSTYELGSGFGHVALEVDDAYQACDDIARRGGSLPASLPPATFAPPCAAQVVRPAGPMKHGTTVIAFVEDPDGYRIELIQKGTRGG